MSTTTNGSELKARIVLTHDMRPATDSESSRYALGCLQAIPRHDNTGDSAGAWLTATTGCIAAVSHVSGECKESCLIPPDVLPSKKAHWGKSGEVTIEVNGECRASFGQFAQRPENGEGVVRFPKLDQAIPGQVSDETHYSFSIDPQLLLDLAESLGRTKKSAYGRDERDQRSVTLFVSKKYDWNKPIAVVGVKGFGVIMPMGGPGDSETSDKPSDYNAMANRFAIDCEKSRK